MRAAVGHAIALLACLLAIGALPSAAESQSALAEAVTPAPPAPPQLPFVQPPGARTARGFDVSGLLQKATVSPCEPDASGHARSAGGFAWVNGIRYTIPCNTMVLLQGTTLSWGDLIGGEDAHLPALTVAAGPAAQTQTGVAHPAIEIRIIGNTLDSGAVAGIVWIGQHAAMKGSGYVTSIDYKAGRLGVAGIPGGSDEAILELNDPIIVDPTDPAFGKGRYSSGQSSDPRFSTDQSNPIVRAATGYPMCIPRYDPSLDDDPLCPRRNRPPKIAPSCRTLADVGSGPGNRRASETLPSPAPSRSDSAWCASFVMKYPPGTRLDQRGSFVKPDGAVVAHAEVAGPAEPDSRHMAPFQIGDFVTYSGTLTNGGGAGASGAAVISVHAIEANLGIFTAPGSLPVYAAIKAVSLAADSTAAPFAAASGVAQDLRQRLALEAVVTDVTAIADLYFVDLEPGNNVPGFPRQGRVPGQEMQRWLTPNAITGEVGAVGSSGFQIGGGITTKHSDPRPGRVNLQAARVNAGVLTAPTRYVRLVVRSLCDPGNVNARAEVVPANGTTAACLKRARVPGGLYSGHFLAPAEHIFADTALPGDPPVAKDLWALGFLVNGEGGSGREGDAAAPGALFPTPW